MDMNVAALFRRTVEALFNPFFIGLIAYTFLLIALFLRGNIKVIRISLFAVLLLWLLCSTDWFTQAITGRLEHQYPVVSKIDPNIHWVVVFGGGQQKHVKTLPVNQLLSGESVRRLLEGVRLYRHLPEAKLILSGGGEPDVTASEAAHLATLATWFSIPPRDLIMETASINTVDEAAEIKQWIHQQPFYLVTSAIHMPRSMALCRKQGLNPIAAPSGYVSEPPRNWLKRIMPHPDNLSKITYAWHEILGWVWGYITCRI